MRGRLSVVAALLVLLAVPVGAGATVISDFEDGTLQGWTLNPSDNGGTLSNVNVGNPGKSMEAVDTTGGIGLKALAPSAYTGDLSGFTTITWDEYVPDNGSATVQATAIQIVGSDGTTWRTDDTLGPLDTWNSRSVDLVAANWTQTTGTASFASVLANVVSLLVDMDTSSSSSNVIESRVDNVALVPEPDAIGMVLMGLTGLAVIGRRRTARR